MVSSLASWFQRVSLHKSFPLLSTLAITFLAGAIRFLNLSNPSVLVFDETYYVKDAYTLGRFGSERVWPENANVDFQAGNPNVFEDIGSYIVHPPFGKWIIWLGINLFGVESSFSWRFSTALLGTLSVPLLILIARQLTRSAGFAAIAGFLLAIEGHAVVMSRTAILDGILTFFVLLSFWILIQAVSSRKKRIAGGTIALGFQPSLLALGVTMGLAGSVKWSAAYFLAAFGLYAFYSDWKTRAAFGFSRFGAIAQGVLNALLLAVSAGATYLVTWSGWIGDSQAWGRNAEENWWLSLLSYHRQILEFHTGLTKDHPYESNALLWLINYRPTAFYFEEFEGAACGVFSDCVVAITAMPNLVIWFGGLLAFIWLLRNRMRAMSAQLVALGFLAGWLPWLIFFERTAFQFYAVVISPFIVLALTLALQHYHKRGFLLRVSELRERNIVRLLVAASLVGIFYLSLWTGLAVPYELWRVQLFLPFWI